MTVWRCACPDDFVDNVDRLAELRGWLGDLQRCAPALAWSCVCYQFDDLLGCVCERFGDSLGPARQDSQLLDFQRRGKWAGRSAILATLRGQWGRGFGGRPRRSSASSCQWEGGCRRCAGVRGLRKWSARCRGRQPPGEPPGGRARGPSTSRPPAREVAREAGIAAPCHRPRASRRPSQGRRPVRWHIWLPSVRSVVVRRATE